MYTIIDSTIFNIVLFVAGLASFLYITYWLAQYLVPRPHIEIKITPKGDRYFTIEPPLILVVIALFGLSFYFCSIFVSAFLKITA